MFSLLSLFPLPIFIWSEAEITSSKSRLTVMTSPSEHASARVGTMEPETPRPFLDSLPDVDDDEDTEEETEESLPFPAPKMDEIHSDKSS